MEGSPEILLADQSDCSHGIDLSWLRQLGKRALNAALAVPREASVLPTLHEIEVTLVDDAEISRVHGEFMDLPEPTDVITFHHGEILISVETAVRQAGDYGRSLRDEVALYLVHGLLHLAGYEDKRPEDFEEMAALQERILKDSLNQS